MEAVPLSVASSRACGREMPQGSHSSAALKVPGLCRSSQGGDPGALAASVPQTASGFRCAVLIKCSSSTSLQDWYLPWARGWAVPGFPRLLNGSPATDSSVSLAESHPQPWMLRVAPATL